MKKHLFLPVLAALLVLTGRPTASASTVPDFSPPEPPAAVYFSDVPATAWHCPYISALYERGVIQGIGNGAFDPGGTVTWGQAFRFILGAVGVEVEAVHTGDEWALDYLEPAIENRLVFTFDPAFLDAPVRRLDVARMTARAMDLVAISGESPYADCADGYAVELFEKGIMQGELVNGQRFFFPDEPITRAEMSALIWRVMESDYAETMLRVSNYWIDPLETLPLSALAPEQFSTGEDGRITYDGGDFRLGVDVSEHKGEIDWQATAGDGIDFAMLRCGGRLMQSGTIFEDKYFRQNAERAGAAGLDVGVYFFSQALNAQEGLEEAEFVLDLLRDYDITFPVVCDWEYLGGSDARTWLAEPIDVTAAIDAFCRRIAEEGYTPMVYFNTYCGLIKMDLSKLSQYEFWFAEYADAPSFPYDFRMWQYSDQGSVAGIGSRTDLDIWFVPSEDGEPSPDPEPSPSYWGPTI